MPNKCSFPNAALFPATLDHRNSFKVSGLHVCGTLH